jgi:hypothetical protein
MVKHLYGMDEELPQGSRIELILCGEGRKVVPAGTAASLAFRRKLPAPGRLPGMRDT